MKQNKTAEKRIPLLESRETVTAAPATTHIEVAVIPESWEVQVHQIRRNDPNRVLEREMDGGDDIVQKIGAIPLSHMARTPDHIAQEAIQQAQWDKFAHSQDQ